MYTCHEYARLGYKVLKSLTYVKIEVVYQLKRESIMKSQHAKNANPIPRHKISTNKAIRSQRLIWVSAITVHNRLEPQISREPPRGAIWEPRKTAGAEWVRSPRHKIINSRR
jgi:hypothetical protein